MAPKAAAGWAMGGLGVVLCLAVTFGFSTRAVELNLGPGDTPFVRGFEPDSDVDNKVGWHWTTYDAAIALPFETAGSTVETTLRYARVFGQEAVVDVTVGSVPTERFRARGGEVRTTTVRADGVQGGIDLAIRADSHEGRNLGLRLDRVRVEVVSGEPLRLRRVAALRPVLVATLLFAGLLILGASPLVAGSATLVGALGFSARAWFDLFGAWRQTHVAPEMILASTLILLGLREAMARWLAFDRTAATHLTSAALITMLFRLALVSHPDFYYPDLLTHTRVVQTIRAEGVSFFLNPAEALNAQGAWTKPVLGSVSSLPYAVVFHTPFAVLAAVLHLSTDQIETALKAGSSLISTLPILLAGLLAARLSMPTAAALMLCVIPTYTSRLSFALMPALSGHVFDLLVLLSVATVIADGRVDTRRGMFVIAGALLAGHLAYTSSVVNEGLFMAVLITLLLATGRAGWPSAGRLLLAEGAAAGLAFLLYYRHFVGDVLGLAGRLSGLAPATGATASASVYPIESFWALLMERTDTFFGWSYTGLALAGVWFLGRRTGGSRVVQAWTLTYLGLIFLRAKIPDVFRYGHETLFLTPLIALLAGSALILAWRRGGAARFAALVGGVGLVLVSFREQWLAVADQLANAL